MLLSGRKWLALSLLVLIPFLIYFFWPEKNTEKTDSNKTRIVFVHTDIEDYASFGKSSKYISELIDKFEKLHPDIEVKQELLPNYSNLKHQYFLINLGGKTNNIDVMALDMIWINEFAKAGWILNLDRYTDKNDLNDFISELYVDSNSYNGSLYALPWIFGTGLIYYRKDLLEKYGFSPPESFEEMAYQAKYILEKEKRPDLHGFLWQGYESEGLICNLFEYLYGHGGSLFDNGKLVIDSPENTAALTFVRNLFLSHISPDVIKTKGKAELRNIYLQGNAVFLRDWSYVISPITGKGSPLYGKVGVKNILPFKGYKSSPVIGGYTLGINKYSKHPKESYELMKFLTSYEAQKYITLNTNFMPSRKSVYKDKELLTENPFIMNYYKGVIPTMRIRPVSPYYLIYSNILQTEFTGILFGLNSVTDGLERMKKQIELMMRVSENKKEDSLSEKN